jgi:hypothetical protein
MKNRWFVGAALAAVLAGVMIVTPGCEKQKVEDFVKKNKATIEKLVRTAANRGAKEGLNAWAKKKPEAAKEAADALAKNIDEVILPYLNGGNIGTSDSVDQLLSSSLFVDVPDDVKTAVLAAAAVLDLYLPAPAAGEALSADHVDFLKAFFTGLRDGVNDFNSRSPKGGWLH